MAKSGKNKAFSYTALKKMLDVNGPSASHFCPATPAFSEGSDTHSLSWGSGGNWGVMGNTLGALWLPELFAVALTGEL